MARATWFCIDIEAGGPVPGLYDLLSLGAHVVTPTAEGGWAVDEEPFYVEIVPTAPRVDPGAMKVNGLDLEALAAHGTPMAEALDALSAFVARKKLPGSRAVFVGHNAPFDWSFVSYAYHDAGLPNPFGYNGLCTKALAMGVLGLHWIDTNKETLAERLTLPPVEVGKVHNAVYDAWYQAHILAELLRRQGLIDC
ncbi:MAG: hypothetical protein RLZZ383_2606 [Pseudomonadota bacterium]